MSQALRPDALLQKGTYLGSQVEGMVFTCLKPGDLLVVPPGWAVAKAALSPSLSIAWHLLPAKGLQSQLEVSRVLAANMPVTQTPPSFMLVRFLVGTSPWLRAAPERRPAAAAGHKAGEPAGGVPRHGHQGASHPDSTLGCASASTPPCLPACQGAASAGSRHLASSGQPASLSGMWKACCLLAVDALRSTQPWRPMLCAEG